MGNAIRQTVFILGAGASKEVDLPLGLELKGEIADALDISFEDDDRLTSGDRTIVQALRRIAELESPHSNRFNTYLKAAWRIRDAMPLANSIDSFLDSHVDEPCISICGKLGIARTILSAERNSTLFVDRNVHGACIDFAVLEPTWFALLFRLLVDGCRPGQIEARLRSIALIDFNYDRCVEHYLWHSLRNYYALGDSDATRLMSALTIQHPYGKVAELPWRNSRPRIAFGGDVDATELCATADQIQTFSEGTAPGNLDHIRIQELMANAERLVFLGFAFHRMNLDLLFPRTGSVSTDSRRQMFATGFGLSDTDTQEIRDDVATRTGISAGQIQIRNQLKCRELLQEFWRSLFLV